MIDLVDMDIRDVEILLKGNCPFCGESVTIIFDDFEEELHKVI